MLLFEPLLCCLGHMFWVSTFLNKMASQGKIQYLVWPPLTHKHTLNSFGETVLKFSLVIFWYIILGFLQYFPEFFFRFRLSFISFSVQVIPYCLYNIQVWTLWRPVHDCQCFISCFSLQIWFHWDLAVCLGSLSCWKIKTIPNQALSRRNGMMN